MKNLTKSELFSRRKQVAKKRIVSLLCGQFVPIVLAVVEESCSAKKAVFKSIIHPLISTIGSSIEKDQALGNAAALFASHVVALCAFPEAGPLDQLA